VSISEGEDGRALLNCFAGCDYTDVVAALGLSVVDLFAHNGHPGSDAQRAKKAREPKSKTKSEPQQTVVTTDELPDGTYWEFTSPEGEVLYIQRHKGAYYQKIGEDRWKDDLEGVSQVLYRLPELIDGVRAGETVYHVEGSKDVETAHERLGLCATTSGSTSSWRPEFKSYYAGADVVIVPDNDDPGRKYADTVAQDLVGVARSVKVVHLPDLAERDDLTDWLDAGHTKEEFFALVEKTVLYDGTEAEPPPSEVEAEPHANGSSVTIKTLADAITVEDHFARDAGDKLYRFSGGCYRQYAERYIRRRVKELLEAWGKADKWSSHKASEVAEYIRADAPELWERPPADEVNVANGILDLETHAARARFCLPLAGTGSHQVRRVRGMPRVGEVRLRGVPEGRP
jgi:hypothetical protein